MQNEINVTQLILFCHEEMETRDYSEDYKCRVSKAWDALVEWMDSHHIDKFSPEIGNTFLDEKVGTHLPGKDLIKSQRVCVRAIRMLISLHTKGYIEEHSPTTEHIFTGALGKFFLHYLDYRTYAVASNIWLITHGTKLIKVGHFLRMNLENRVPVVSK